jgi:hypothetical protein
MDAVSRPVVTGRADALGADREALVLKTPPSDVPRQGEDLAAELARLDPRGAKSSLRQRPRARARRLRSPERRRAVRDTDGDGEGGAWGLRTCIGADKLSRFAGL